jgi:hypothetical protein
MTPIPAVGHMPNGAVAVKALPAWLHRRRRAFVATMLASLFASQKPFTHFKKGVTQVFDFYSQAFKAVWPESTYTVSEDDCLFHLVCSFFSYPLFLSNAAVYRLCSKFRTSVTRSIASPKPSSRIIS